ncbi:MAG TPA: TRAP transporter small permease subunit [Longimicrobiales bacterium]|nr:TRAP transporter small permease subunit [Longimicrobiales bacterium]
MTTWLRLARAIDRLTGWIGRSVAWLALVLVLIGAFNAIARYAGRFLGVSLSSNAWIELQWYLFSAIFLLGSAYALREDAHVRVDVLFAGFSERLKAWINIAGTLLLLLPFSAFMLWVSLPAVRNSWRIREGSPDPGGLARWPLKTLVLLCFALLLLQGVAELIKQIARLRDLPPHATHGAERATHGREGL